MNTEREYNNSSNNFPNYILNVFFIMTFLYYFKITVSKIYFYFRIKSILRGQYMNNNNLLNTCVICLEDINYNEYIINLPCNHYYHKECVYQWIIKNQNCPICRATLL